MKTTLLQWYDLHGRKDLPWQHPRHPYRVWVSEIMLQQTQVQTVIPYFLRFMGELPTIQSLAEADEDQVLALWSGLGYYSRARNLHQAAKIIQRDFAGQMPSDLEQLQSLPGIGPTTAAAICSQAFNQATAILDGNVKRVLARYYLVEGQTEQSAVKKQLWQLAQQAMPAVRCADYTQAIMDLGAVICTPKNPNCTKCPLQIDCLAKAHNRVNELPSPKIKKILPVKSTLFLLLHDQNKIYLEKRPPAGIWGSLWCLPSLAENEDPLDFLEKHDLQGQAPEAITHFKHSFTHFHLQIQAISIAVQPLSAPIDEGSRRWFQVERINELGIARPTARIISHWQQL